MLGLLITVASFMVGLYTLVPARGTDIPLWLRLGLAALLLLMACFIARIVWDHRPGKR